MSKYSIHTFRAANLQNEGKIIAKKSLTEAEKIVDRCDIRQSEIPRNRFDNVYNTNNTSTLIASTITNLSQTTALNTQQFVIISTICIIINSTTIHYFTLTYFLFRLFDYFLFGAPKFVNNNFYFAHTLLHSIKWSATIS